MATGRRVLVLDVEGERRRRTCSLLEAWGFEVVGAGAIHDLDAWLDDEGTVLLVDVSLPRTWDDVLAEEAALRPFVDQRCPIVLHGARPAAELAELAWATRATAHSVTDADGSALRALLERLLPRPISEPPPRVRATTHVTRRPIRMLLVDDSEITLELAQELLTERGFDVRIAVAHGEVRSLVATWAPEVVVADVKRPDMPGAELCSRLKASLGVEREVVVLLCSSLPRDELAALAQAAGADGWVSKADGLGRFVEAIATQTQRLFAGRPRRAVAG